MDIKSLEIRTKINYNWDDIIYINDFNADLLEIIKKKKKELVLIFIILDMFLTQIMIIILQNLCILLLVA